MNWCQTIKKQNRIIESNRLVIVITLKTDYLTTDNTLTTALWLQFEA